MTTSEAHSVESSDDKSVKDCPVAQHEHTKTRLSLVFGIGINVLAFAGTSYAFSESGHCDTEDKRQKKKINGAKIEWHNFILWMKGCVKRMNKKNIQ